MKKNNYSGLFIVFAGLDGSGSNIQASLLAGVLKKEGYRVFLTKEPTNGIIGGMIRAQLAGEWKTTNHCLQLLFAADRAMHLKNQIIPALNNGKIVICDRYIFSAIAFGSVDIENLKWLKQINDEFIVPDITFFIDLAPKICAMRLKKSRYDLELFKEEKKLETVRKTYYKLASEEKNIYKISAEQEEMAIIEKIINTTKKYLGLKY